MSTGRGPWRDGRRAWERLAGWYREGGSPPAARDADADPLVALSDIGLMRRLLDEVELEAVRSARGRGRSWAEIAIKLGVTRQSAWERWRDLDVEPARPEEGEPGPGAAAYTAPPEAVPGRAIRGRARRTQWVTVPDVVGRSFDDARAILAERGLIGLSSDPAGRSVAELAHDGAVVARQHPRPGVDVPPGAPVDLWPDQGGGSGVREPRRPQPTPQTSRKVLDEPSEEAVG